MNDVLKQIQEAAAQYAEKVRAEEPTTEAPPARRDLRGCEPCKKKMLDRMTAVETTLNHEGHEGTAPLGTQKNSSPSAVLRELRGASVLPSMKFAAVITAFNEGEEVQATVKSLAESITGPETELLIVVVDDGSTDGSCDFADGSFAKAKLRKVGPGPTGGVGRSRNAGLAAALKWGADVVSFHDAHMRFPPAQALSEASSSARASEDRSAKEGRPPGVLEQLARKALESGAIVTSKAKGWWNPDGSEKPFRAWGADLHWNLKYGLQPKYRIYAKGQPEWIPVPCPMGACYVFSRATVERLMAPTGRLWDDVAGRYGFSEQALAVKAFLLGVPVLVSRDLATHHLYRSKNPVPNAGTEIWRNVCYTMAALLSEETFNLRFRSYCETYLGAKNVRDIAAQAVGARLAVPAWTREDERRIFTHLCGRGATVTEAHPDHAWLAEVESAALAVQSKIKNQKSAMSLLQWRPGESTFLIKRLVPTAQITCLEWNAHRAVNWQAVSKALGVRLCHVDLKDWADPPAAGFLKTTDAPRRSPDEPSCPSWFNAVERERFDLITIGGEFPEECRRTAERLLAPGGRIVVNPTADEFVIADEFRREANRLLKEFEEARRKAVTSNQSPVSSGQSPVLALRSLGEVGTRNQSPVTTGHCSLVTGHYPSVTVCLLNWRRPENVGAVLDCLGRQTLRPRVVLWDNHAEAETGTALQWRRPSGELAPMHEHPLIDLVVRPTRNMGCMPRWWLASVAETEYVCSLDDDLGLADERVLEDAACACGEECPDGIVGFFGWSRAPGKSYKDGRLVSASPKGDARVDVVKGRFMLLRRALLERVPLAIPGLSCRTVDDIYLSLCISACKPGFHLLPARLGGRSRNLPERGVGVSVMPDHYELREGAVLALDRHFGKAATQ